MCSAAFDWEERETLPHQNEWCCFGEPSCTEFLGREALLCLEEILLGGME